MSKFRKSKLASAMLCTLLFGGNVAGAVQKDVSKGVSKNDLFKNQEDKELENRNLGDSGNRLLKYFLYYLEVAAGFGKLADEVVGVAQVKNYIKNKKFSPLGRLSIYKNLAAKFRAKTMKTMRNLVAKSHKNRENIFKFFCVVIDMVDKNKES